MANEEHIEILTKGPVAWNEWRAKNPKVIPDLSGADFRGVSFDSEVRDRAFIGFDLRQSNMSKSKFYECNFHDADLSGSDLSNGNFVGAYFFGCNLSSVNLTEAALGGADFSSCDFRGAKFFRCSADYTNFNDAWLNHAEFDGGFFEGTKFLSNDLSETRGLDTIRAGLPCVIGLETIFISQGKIPESFLLACGASDTFIEYLPSLIGAMEGIQFYSCFISYSSKDDEFARRLYSRMRDARLRVWFAPEDLKGGRKTHEQIDEAIRVFDKLLLVLSENSLQSEWVMTEIRKARKRESETGKDLAIEVREYHIPNFSNWKAHDSFEGAFARLLSDLKNE